MNDTSPKPYEVTGEQAAAHPLATKSMTIVYSVPMTFARFTRMLPAGLSIVEEDELVTDEGWTVGTVISRHRGSFIISVDMVIPSDLQDKALSTLRSMHERLTTDATDHEAVLRTLHEKIAEVGGTIQPEAALAA